MALQLCVAASKYGTPLIHLVTVKQCKAYGLHKYSQGCLSNGK